MARLAVFAVLTAALFTGCGGDGSSEQRERTTTAAPSSWTSPPWRSAAERERSLRAFNGYVETTAAAWAGSPLVLAATFLRLERPNAASTALVMETNPDGGSRAVVTASLEGLLDDSVQAARYVLTFERDADGGWRLRAVTWRQRCAAGRGHQAFLPAPCV